VPTRYFEEASSVGLKAGIPYGLGTLWTALRYSIHRTGMIQKGIFDKELKDVTSRHHHPVIFGTAQDSGVKAL